MKIYCPDCKKKQEITKDLCHIHSNCGEYAYICSVCGSLNVDYEARELVNQAEELKRKIGDARNEFD